MIKEITELVITRTIKTVLPLNLPNLQDFEVSDMKFFSTRQETWYWMLKSASCSGRKLLSTVYHGVCAYASLLYSDHICVDVKVDDTKNDEIVAMRFLFVRCNSED